MSCYLASSLGPGFIDEERGGGKLEDDSVHLLTIIFA